MKYIRKGNDIHIKWLVFDGKEPFELHKEFISLYILHPNGKRELVSDFKVEDNAVIFVFWGKDQHCTGKYNAELVIHENEKGMITTDVCSFVNLTPITISAKTSNISNVEVESIELTSSLEIGGNGSYDDAKIKADIAALQSSDAAQAAQLTELSAEVGGLSERIDNLPSGESSVFEAIYLETTYDKIVEAYLANKHCICRYGNRFLSLVELDYQGRDKASFSALVGDIQYTVYCLSNNTWGNTFYKVEKTTNKVTSLSSSSTDNQYPSAKAVYDFVQTTLGTLINGDY